MPNSLFKDDNNKDSSLRLVFIPFMAAVGTFLVKVMQKFAKMWKQKPAPAQPIPTSPVQKPGVPVEDSEPLPTPLPTSTTKEIVIDRFQQNIYATLGRAGIWNGSAYLYNFVTLELPWKDNQRRISCIPEGEYKAVATFRSSNGKYALWLIDVPDRSEIMMHTANWTSEILGCIAPGVRHEGSGAGVHVVFSREVMEEKIREHFPPGTELKIKIRKT